MSARPKVLTIEPEIIGEKQHNLRAQYFGAACPYSRKLICFLFPKKHSVVLGQLLRFYRNRAMRLVKLHRAIRFKPSPYVSSYIANNTAKREDFNHDDVKKAFYKLMNNALYEKTIENVAQQIDICWLNEMESARRLAEKPHCVNLRVFDGQLAPPEKQVDAASAKKQQQQEALVRIEMRLLNHFIKKPFNNGFA